MGIITEDMEVWSFGGLTFAREVDAASYRIQPKRQSIFTVDHVLDTDEAYRDSGGGFDGPFPLRAVFNTLADAVAFASLEGMTATLAGPGYSGTRLLTNPDVTLVNATWYAVDVEMV